MNKLRKSITVPTIIVCTLGWVWGVSKVIDDKKDMTTESENVHKVDINDCSIGYKVTNGYESIMTEYERLKEEERKRLAELERLRLERLEKIRLAKIEEAKKLAEQKRLDEIKKSQVVSRGNTEEVGNWMTFNATYYGKDCLGCGNYTFTGINISNTIYYKGYRIVASDRNVLPMGTLVDIKTPNERFKGIIADVGGGIKGYRLDVLVESEAKASQIGRHDVQLRIIGKMEIK